MLGRLHHPNIVTVFEHGERNGFFYLLMEYVDGVNLRQAMRAGRFTPGQALDIVPGICDALPAAHTQGIWHRDIKRENILLDKEGKVKIADFGIARIVGDSRYDFTLTRTGNALGSISYMAQTYNPNHPMPSPEVEASMKASLKTFLHSNGIDESDVLRDYSPQASARPIRGGGGYEVICWVR